MPGLSADRGLRVCNSRIPVMLHEWYSVNSLSSKRSARDLATVRSELGTTLRPKNHVHRELGSQKNSHACWR